MPLSAPGLAGVLVRYTASRQPNVYYHRIGTPSRVQNAWSSDPHPAAAYHKHILQRFHLRRPKRRCTFDYSTCREGCVLCCCCAAGFHGPLPRCFRLPCRVKVMTNVKGLSGDGDPAAGVPFPGPPAIFQCRVCTARPVVVVTRHTGGWCTALTPATRIMRTQRPVPLVCLCARTHADSPRWQQAVSCQVQQRGRAANSGHRCDVDAVWPAATSAPVPGPC